MNGRKSKVMLRRSVWMVWVFRLLRNLNHSLTNETELLHSLVEAAWMLRYILPGGRRVK